MKTKYRIVEKYMYNPEGDKRVKHIVVQMLNMGTWMDLRVTNSFSEAEDFLLNREETSKQPIVLKEYEF